MRIKRKKRKHPNRIVAGVAWYRPEQWPRLREISADAEDLEDTYEEWLRSAEQNLREIRVSNLELRKVDVDAEELLAWCNERGILVNAKARSEYAAQRVQALDRNSTPGGGRS